MHDSLSETRFNWASQHEHVIFLLVEEITISHVVVWVVSGHWFWGHLLVTVSEVDVSHVIGIVQQIWIQSVIEPGVVKIVLAFPMSLGHPPSCPA